MAKRSHVPQRQKVVYVGQAEKMGLSSIQHHRPTCRAIAFISGTHINALQLAQTFFRGTLARPTIRLGVFARHLEHLAD